MIRQDVHRIDPKRRATIDPKKRQFATPIYKQQDYPHRLNLSDTPPTAEITLEQFEQWAIDRLRSANIMFNMLLFTILTSEYSSRRDRGMLLSQQDPRGDRSLHRPPSPEIPPSKS